MAVVEIKEYHYWQVVIRTLQEIFEFSAVESADVVSSLIHNLEERPPDERLLFFHAEPLYIAAELAAKPVDESHIARYKTLALQLHWTA